MDSVFLTDSYFVYKFDLVGAEILSMGKENGSSVKFIIIGGGIAGLAAAHKLIKSGERDIVVLEAKSRLGGRIHTIREGSILILLFDIFVIFLFQDVCL